MFMVVSFPWPVPSANAALTGVPRRAVRPRTTTRAAALTRHNPTSAEHSPLAGQLKLLDRTLAAQKR